MASHITIQAPAGLHIETLEENQAGQYRFHLCAWFSTDDELLSSNQRMRGIFLHCTSEANEVVRMSNFLKDRMLFAGDVKQITTDEGDFHYLDVQLELGKELDAKILPGNYYLQASAFQYTSNIIRFTVT